MDLPLPLIPAKRYFTIGEVAQLCGVKPHVLRYWEQEFTQLRPMKRRGNRRYYQHHEVLMIRRIRDLLYDEGFTIVGARNKLREAPSLLPPQADAFEGVEVDAAVEDFDADALEEYVPLAALLNAADSGLAPVTSPPALGDIAALRKELSEIRALLAGDD